VLLHRKTFRAIFAPNAERVCGSGFAQCLVDWTRIRVLNNVSGPEKAGGFLHNESVTKVWDNAVFCMTFLCMYSRFHTTAEKKEEENKDAKSEQINRCLFLTFINLTCVSSPQQRMSGTYMTDEPFRTKSAHRFLQRLIPTVSSGKQIPNRHFN
jgi:hypothetical protein